MAERHWLAPLLAPHSVAIVGASPRPGSAGHGAISVLRAHGFAGTFHFVNPRYREIEGQVCHPSVTALPSPPDLAIMTIANQRLEPAFDDAVAGGAGSIEIFGSCHLDNDTDPPLVDRLRAKAKAAGIPVSGGNSLGYVNFDRSFYVMFDTMPERTPGHVAMFCHSGTLYWELTYGDPRYRYNMSVSQGLEINGTVGDYIDYALAQPTTRAIALCLETVRDPANFMAALAQARDRDIPVIAIKMARTEPSKRFAISHSGGLAGDDDAFSALFERYGVLRAETLDEFATTAMLMAHPKRAAPGRLSAMFDSGGMRELAVDTAQDIGLEFAAIGKDTVATLAANLEGGLQPDNPLDVWSTYNDYERRTANCLRALSDDPDTGLTLFGFAMSDNSAYPGGFITACEEAAPGTEKPIFAMAGFSGVSNRGTAETLHDAGMPVLDGLQNGLRAVRHAFAYRDARLRPPPQVPAPPAAGVVADWCTRLGRDGTLDEAQGLGLLAEFGIPAAEAVLANDRAEALDAAEEMGFPVALKTAAPGHAHKSDVDGVRLDLANATLLGAAYDELAARLGPRVTVSPMAGAGIELAFGMVRDDQFGPLILVGAGGALIELIRDRAFALPPIDAAGARRLLDRLRVRTLLEGVRGRPAADLDAVAEALARFSVMVAALGDCLAEVDVNPVIAGPAGCQAVDALVVGRTR